MTDARTRALEAVAEAAFAWWRRAPDDEWKREQKIGAALKALAALDALPAPQQAGETVEVRAAVIFYSPHDWIVRGEAGWDARDMEEEARGRGRPLSAILTARVPYPAPIPTIDAEVTP